MKKLENSKLLKEIAESDSFKNYFDTDIYNDLLLFHYDRTETILRQSKKTDYLYYLYSGRCKVIAYTENGKAIIINNLKAPCLIGEIELINNDNPFTVDTLSECLVVAIPLNKYRSTLLSDSKFLYKLSSSLADKERKTVLAYTHYVSYPLENRLARFILDYSQGDVFSIKKVVIAESLGVSYRHLETVMSGFVKKKYLHKEKLNYYIKDRNKLLELSKAMDLF